MAPAQQVHNIIQCLGKYLGLNLKKMENGNPKIHLELFYLLKYMFVISNKYD